LHDRDLRCRLLGPRLRQLPLQLHRDGGRGLLLRGPDDPAGALHRPPAASLCGAREGRCAMSESETQPLLSVRGLRKTYADKVVLADIDLEITAGEVVCLIGSSGSGKSTLLRCLNLLEEIDDGVIQLEGREISDPR